MAKLGNIVVDAKCFLIKLSEETHFAAKKKINRGSTKMFLNMSHRHFCFTDAIFAADRSETLLQLKAARPQRQTDECMVPDLL